MANQKSKYGLIIGGIILSIGLINLFYYFLFHGAGKLYHFYFYGILGLFVLFKWENFQDWLKWAFSFVAFELLILAIVPLIGQIFFPHLQGKGHFLQSNSTPAETFYLLIESCFFKLSLFPFFLKYLPSPISTLFSTAWLGLIGAMFQIISVKFKRQ